MTGQGDKEGWLRSKGREIFGIDRRSIALFRIGLGLMLVADLVKRSITLRAHYTDEGILPLAALFELQDRWNLDPYIFRIYMWSGETWVTAGLMLFAGALAVCMIVGYRTRLVTVLSLYMLISLHQRNHWVDHTGDSYLGVALFWAMFLPMGGYFSIDRLRNPRKPILPQQVVSAGTAAFLLQIAIFYIMAGVIKHQYPAWADGSAVGYFSRLQSYTTWFGIWLSDHPALCEFATWYTLVLEGIAPVLFFSPWFTAQIRIVLVVLFITFHAVIHLTVFIGILEILAMAAICLFLPAMGWDLLAWCTPTRLKVLWSRVRSGFLARYPAYLAQARAGFTTGVPRNKLATAFIVACMVLIVITNYRSTYNGLTILPKGPVDLLDKTPLIGRLVPDREKGDDSFLTKIDEALPINKMSKFLRLKQHWVIFGPISRTFTGWFLVLGLREDGTVVDVWNRKEFENYDVPEDFAKSFPNHNWRRYWNVVLQPQNKPLLPHLSRHLVHDWERRTGERLTHLTILKVHDPEGTTHAQSFSAAILYESGPEGGQDSWLLPNRDKLEPQPFPPFKGVSVDATFTGGAGG